MLFSLAAAAAAGTREEARSAGGKGSHHYPPPGDFPVKYTNLSYITTFYAEGLPTTPESVSESVRRRLLPAEAVATVPAPALPAPPPLPPPAGTTSVFRPTSGSSTSWRLLLSSVIGES